MFTEKEKENWKAFEKVRRSGMFNMFDKYNVMLASGLSKEEYLFTIKNYAALADEAGGKEDCGE